VSYKPIPPPTEDDWFRFWVYVEEIGDCWEWTGALAKGYGEFSLRHRPYGAHRVAYAWFFGDPCELEVDHRCFNERCVRPEHLRLATSSQNSENRRGATRRSKTGVRAIPKY
jgi:hypothetical protein